jgi:hypothetical protein
MGTRQEKSQNVIPLAGNLERNPDPQLSCSRDAEGALAMPFSGAEALRGPADERCLRATPGGSPRVKFDSSERRSDTLLKPAAFDRWRWIERGH